MLFFFFKRVAAPSHDPVETYQSLKRDRSFDTEDHDKHLTMKRNRVLPDRGIFRLLIPRIIAKVVVQAQEVRYKLRLDGVGLFFLFMLVGGVVVELTMPRDRYPREYPAAVVYGLAAFYFVLTAIETVMTHHQLGTAIKKNQR